MSQKQATDNVPKLPSFFTIPAPPVLTEQWLRIVVEYHEYAVTLQNQVIAQNQLIHSLNNQIASLLKQDMTKPEPPTTRGNSSQLYQQAHPSTVPYEGVITSHSCPLHGIYKNPSYTTTDISHSASQ